jgi:hypothetical protein
VSEDPLRLLADGKYASFDGMTWPAVGEPTADVGWKLRYAGDALTQTDRYFAASIVEAYLAVVAKPARDRSKIIAQLRRAYRMQQKKAVPK